jgi:hypothetical protein
MLLTIMLFDGQVKMGHRYVVALLIEHKADVHAEDNYALKLWGGGASSPTIPSPSHGYILLNLESNSNIIPDQANRSNRNVPYTHE